MRPKLQPANAGRIVAIDIESSDFVLAEDTLEAAKELLSRRPDAQIWCVRVGCRGVHRFGPRTTVRA